MRSAAFAIIAIALTLAFQNCSGLEAFPLATIDPSLQQDKMVLQRLTEGGLAKIWVSASNASQAGSTVSVMPPVRTDALGLEAGSSAPKYGASASLRKTVVDLAAGQSLRTTSGTIDLVSDNYTIIALIEGPLANGNLVSLVAGQPGDPELSISYADGFLKFARESGVSFKHAVPAQLPPTVIAVNFGRGPKTMQILINGRKIREPLTVGQSAPDLEAVARNLFVGGSGALKLAELIVVNEALSPASMNTLSRLVADRWGLKGVYYEELPDFVSDEPDNLPVEFSQVAAILKNQCANCHTGYHNSWLNLANPSQLKQPQWVVPGNPLASSLYMRLAGSEGGNPSFAKNMPQGGGAISPSERNLIKRWIQALQ